MNSTDSDDSHYPPVMSANASSIDASVQNNDKLKEIEKMANIAEIIELLEESHKNKDWVIDRIKQNKLRVSIRPTMSTIGILRSCPHNFITHILALLRSKEFEDFEGPPPLTQTYHWFFTDIVASSDPDLSTNEQARKIIVLNKLIERTETFKQKDDSTFVLPTGDGVAIGFSDSPEKPLKLALELHKGISRYNLQRREKDRVYIRIGLDTGPVYMIKDLNGQENVWGPGIIMARRVMDLARDMNILASSRIANDIRTLRPEYKQLLHPVGDYSIKHGGTVLIYNVYGDGVGNKKPPQAEKSQKSTAAEEVENTNRRFHFNNIDVLLDVKDTTTFLTHHTLVWNFVNISNEPIDKVFYYLDGDSPKPFPDLNVVIKDEDGKELDIMSLNVNKPYHKEFYAKLRKPLKPNEKGRMTRLEYDWEEPERQFFYRFASDCKKFHYKLTVPKGIEVNQKVVRVSTETGEMVYAKTPATVKYLDNGTEITWSASDIHAFEAYRFDW